MSIKLYDLSMILYYYNKLKILLNGMLNHNIKLILIYVWITKAYCNLKI